MMNTPTFTNNDNNNNITITNPLYIQTPLIYSQHWSDRIGRDVYLKLENLQPSGSFKLRGVSHMMQCALAAVPGGNVEYFCSSGGNAGLAAANAASLLNKPITVCIPTSTPAFVAEKLRAYNATVIIHGAVWAEADKHIRELIAEREAVHNASPTTSPKPAYVPPYDHADIWAGNSTIIDEIYQQIPHVVKPQRPFSCDPKNQEEFHVGAVVAAVGGGGLFNGLCEGLVRHAQHTKTILVGAETAKSCCLAAAHGAGQRVAVMPQSIATSLGASIVSAQSFNYITQEFTDNFAPVVVSDGEAIVECTRLLNEHGMLVEAACGTAFAALQYIFNNTPSQDTQQPAPIAPEEQCCGDATTTPQHLAAQGIVWDGPQSARSVHQKLTPTSPIVVVVCGGSIMSPQMLKYYQELTNTTEYCERFDVGYRFIADKNKAAK